jgi:hypothetical protein
MHEPVLCAELPVSRIPRLQGYRGDLCPLYSCILGFIVSQVTRSHPSISHAFPENNIRRFPNSLLLKQPVQRQLSDYQRIKKNHRKELIGEACFYRFLIYQLTALKIITILDYRWQPHLDWAYIHTCSPKSSSMTESDVKSYLPSLARLLVLDVAWKEIGHP